MRSNGVSVELVLHMWNKAKIDSFPGTEIQPYVEPMLQRLFPLMVNPQISRTLLENVAITLGRLGLIFPNVVGQHLAMFINPWLVTLTPIRDNEEKASAFSGLCEMIKINPQGAVKVSYILGKHSAGNSANGNIQEFLNLCTAIANYVSVPPSLHESFGNVSYFSSLVLVYCLSLTSGVIDFNGLQKHVWRAAVATGACVYATGNKSIIARTIRYLA